LSKSADVQFATGHETTLARCMDEFFRLHAARWGPLGEPLQRFHREAAQAFLETGHLRLSLLRTGDRAGAAVHAFASGKTLYCYLSGFDPEMAKQSPGAVLLGWVIEQAVAEGLEEVDFLRHGEA